MSFMVSNIHSLLDCSIRLWWTARDTAVTAADTTVTAALPQHCHGISRTREFSTDKRAGPLHRGAILKNQFVFRRTIPESSCYY